MDAIAAEVLLKEGVPLTLSGTAEKPAARPSFRPVASLSC